MRCRQRRGLIAGMARSYTGKKGVFHAKPQRKDRKGKNYPASLSCTPAGHTAHSGKTAGISLRPLANFAPLR